MRNQKISVNSQYLLAMACNLRGFLISSVCPDGVVIKKAIGKKAKDTEKERLERLREDFNLLGVPVEIKKQSNETIELLII